MIQDPRLPLWEVDCALLDAVLYLSFDHRELSDCCTSAEVEIPRCPCVTPSHAVVAAAHRACHQPGPLPELIARRLDYVHRDALEELEQEGVEGLAGKMLGQPLGQVPRLAGRLWAVATCGAADARTLQVLLRGALSASGLELLAREVERARLPELDPASLS